MSSDTKPQAASAANLSTGQLRRRYVVALSLIAILVIASQAVVQFLIAGQEHDSRVVNIAGRQRMLSQEITKLGYFILNAESPDAAFGYRRKLEETLSLWQRSHVGLLRGDAGMGLPGKNSNEVIALFGRIQPRHEAIVAAAEAILSSSASAATVARSIHHIKELEPGFLKSMDDIVFLYDREINAKIEFARWLEIGLMSVTLLVLMLEAVLIFAPAARRIQRDMREIASREEDLEHLFAVSPTALLLVAREDLAILRANQKAMNLIGISAAEIARTNLGSHLDENDAANRDFLEKINKGETVDEYEAIILDSRRAALKALVSVRAISFCGQSVFVLGITNITELKKAQQALERFAAFDDMSGLMNRRTGLIMLEKAMARFRRDGGRLAVCFADLDGLKTANDRFGHAQGDWLIRTVAEVLTSVIRASDAVVRLGGDEFLLILHDCSLEEGARLVARAETRLKEIEATEHKPFPMGFSHGIAAFSPARHTTADDLIAEADSLMYQAKQEKKRLWLESESSRLPPSGRGEPK